MARVSLSPGGDLPVAPADWFGRPFSLEHYRDLWGGGPMARFTLNSLIVTCVAVPMLRRRSDVPAIDEGPHLSYAIQWFLFAALAAGFAVLVVGRR